MDHIKFSLGEGAQHPFKKHEGDAGWDLFVSQDCVIYPGDTVDVHTDIRIEMPEGMYARITGRSSSLRKYGLLVNEGIIDNGYTGEMFVCIHNVGKDTILVKKGMRFAQIMFHRIENVTWDEVESIEAKPGMRGDQGFGSTGR